MKQAPAGTIPARRQKKIRVVIMAVLQLHGLAGNSNPHLAQVKYEPGNKPEIRDFRDNP
ncbi:MAG: hypothetical protein ACOYOU_12915 [Kiritimatiellia bacterium]